MKKAFYILVSVNIIIVAIFAFKKYNNGQTGKNQTSYYDQWNEIRKSIYATLPVDSNDIVFIGDSQIECFPVTEIFGDKVKNRGIGGNKTEQLLHRLKEVVISHPKRILIEIGVNDIILNNDTTSAFNNYKKIITTIKDGSPLTSIFIHSIMPVCGDYTKYNVMITGLNANIKEYCKSNNVTYIDLYSKMVTESKLDSTLTLDGLHLNGKGYTIWRQCIHEYLK